MEAKAIGRYLRVTPRKARFVLDQVRGKNADEALAILKFVPNEAARYITLVLESAVANAEHLADAHPELSLERQALRIERAFVDQGPTLKRIHPRAMGRAFRILKRTCHITVVVKEDEKLKAALMQPKSRGAAKAGRGRGAAKPTAAKPAKKTEQPKTKATTAKATVAKDAKTASAKTEE